MTKKRIGMLALIAVILCLVVVTIVTPGTIEDVESYKPLGALPALSLLPPVIAIGLALITKEVYTSLFVGVVTGALLYSHGNLRILFDTMLFQEDHGMINKLADSYNVGILVFLVILGILVAMMNKAGGSAAFGRWASAHIKTRVGAQLATMALGVLIFVDDYFNCLTVGSVMRPVTDGHKVSRAKLAYLIDATAAPVCIIAPISSWAAAVTSSVPDEAGINGFLVFLQTIPVNLYAILTLCMVIFVTVLKVDYGPMRKHELNAIAGDLYTTSDRAFDDDKEEEVGTKAKTIDLILPVVVLILSCIAGMVYSGGILEGASFISAFADCDASVGLALGSVITLIFTFIYYSMRDVLSFKDFAECIPNGFKAMVAPILILTLAWTLSGMTKLLGAPQFVASLVESSAGLLQSLLPLVVFVVAALLAFATGTSWGTFGILIPIVLEVFPAGQMMVICISACLAGAVSGDHSSPISDTTIMASAGAHCNHVNHVSTQIPYVLTVVAICALGYLLMGLMNLAGIAQFAWVVTLLCIGILALVMVLLRNRYGKEKE